jgi:hypothetical protein
MEQSVDTGKEDLTHNTELLNNINYCHHVNKFNIHQHTFPNCNLHTMMYPGVFGGHEWLLVSTVSSILLLVH